MILEWAETGGPTVKAPSRSGYGTSVIGDLIPYELGGKVDLAFACDGLRCRMEIPAGWVSKEASSNANAQECHVSQSTSTSIN